MSEIKENREVSFTDYLSILLKWKKFLIINLLIVSIGATILAFSIDETFKSTTTLMLPGEKEMGLGSLLGGGSALSFGAQLLGGGSASEDLILGILNSRTILSKVVNKYNLYDYYETKDRNYDLLIKSFSGDIIFTPNEFGLIEIHVINRNPQTAADIANYFGYLADSLNIKLNIEQATNNRLFVEKRFNKNQEDIKNAEEAYYKFQKENKAYDIPEQIKAAIFASGTLEAELFQKEILLNSINKKISTTSPQFKDIENQINAIKTKLEELNTDSQKNSLLLAFNKLPDLQIKYLRFYREMEIQNKILEFLYPMYEQAKIDEKKNSPTLLVVDEAVPAQLKYAPKRAFIILGFFFMTFFILMILVFRGEKILNSKKPQNRIEEKEGRFYSRIVRIYVLNRT